MLTNAEHTRRGIGHNNTCGICGHAIEDITHVLKDCEIARDVCKLPVPVDQKHRFFSEPFPSWFLTNICYLWLYRIEVLLGQVFLE